MSVVYIRYVITRILVFESGIALDYLQLLQGRIKIGVGEDIKY